MSTQTDEAFARKLLEQHYNRTSQEPVSIELCRDDPPDLIVWRSQEEIWGVEVTRVYGQVQSIGGGGALGPSIGVSEVLIRFGERVGNDTHDIRKRDYTLSLTAPSPVFARDEPLRQQAFSVWKDKVAGEISAHVEGNKTDKLSGSGFTLLPGGPGTRWSVMAGAGVHLVEPTLNAALELAFRTKKEALPSWKGDCSKRWLLMLNCYPLVDDDDAVAGIRRLLTQSGQDGFDGVFWSGFEDRSLIAVSGLGNDDFRGAGAVT